MEELSRLPRIYETDEVSGLDKLIQMHFFIGGSDWYAAEYCPRERNFFGYAILNNDLECSEWGYFNLDEMRAIRVPPGIEIDRDLYWDVRPAAQVDKIKRAYERKGY